MRPERSIRLSVPSDPACMTIVRAMIERMAELAGFADEEVGQIVLAIDEACTNIMRHQYEGRADERIDIEAAFSDDGGSIEVSLRDYGPWRDPAIFRGRELDDVRPGGLGLHIIRKVMDSVDYEPAAGGGMKLTLLKSLGTSINRETHDRQPQG